MRPLPLILLVLAVLLPFSGFTQIAKDVVTTAEDTPVIFSVTENDNNPKGIDAGTVDLDTSDEIRQTLVTRAEGQLSVDNSGNVTYTPALNYFGTFEHTYSVKNNNGDEAGEGIIEMTVTPVNDPPVAADDAATTNKNISTDIDVANNDTDVDGTVDPNTIDLNTTVAGVQASFENASGTWEVVGGKVRFQPAQGLTGAASTTYSIQDNEGLVSNVANINVTINDVNAPPVANDDAASTPEDTPVDVVILANDTDDTLLDAASVDLDPAVAGKQSTRTTAGGTFSVNASGVLQFVPDANFNGNVVVTYTVNDNDGATSNIATVTITVTAVNDPPVAANDNATTQKNTPVDIDVAANDSDVENGIDKNTIDLDPATAGIQTTRTTADGAWTIVSQLVRYTPAANFVGTTAITYTINDTDGAKSNEATITVTVQNVNSAPVAGNDAAVVNEDTSIAINILANDSDDTGLNPASVDLDPSTAGQQLTLTVAAGTFSVNNAGVLSFVPALNWNGVVTIYYTVQDTDNVVSNVASVEVTVTPVNDPPVAVNDNAATAEDTPVNVNVIANDTDVDGTINGATVDLDVNTAGIQNTRTTVGGQYTVNTAGVVTFTPAANYNGTTVIQYNVQDNEGATSNNASISIVVAAVNDPPVANDDAVSTNKNTAVSFNVITNDTDDGAINAATVDLDPSTGGIQNAITVTGGSFSVNSSGTVTFTPTVNFYGVVAISYTVNDNEGAVSNQATITVTVIHINQKPVATADAVTTDEDTPVIFNVLINDTDDISLNPASVDLNVTSGGIQTTRTTAQGTFAVDVVGNVTFTPVLNFFGTATIQYTVNDNEGATSDPADIVVTVNSVNDKPVANPDAKTVNEDNAAVINVIGNDTDVDGTIVATTVDLNPAVPGIQTSLSVPEGTFSVDASGVVTFVPINNFFGTVVITYTVNDNDGATSDPATITITVNPVNDPPIANNDVASTSQGQAVSLNVLANDIDVDGTINAATVDLNPGAGGIQTTRTVASGTYEVDGTGMVTFTPVGTFSGTSSISYTVQDNAGATSNIATISILVNFVNNAPVANDDAATTNEDTAVSLNVVSNDTDDGTINAATVDLNPSVAGIQNSITTAEGTFTVNGSGVVTFTPSLNFNGTVSITYTVEDNIGETSNIATITITVTPVNDAPVATNDAATTNEDVPVMIDVLANDSDVDGTLNPATVDLVVSTDEIDRTRTVSQGVFTVSETTGVVTFTPSPNFFGTASTTYNVRDNLGAKSNTATISVTVVNVNDPPSFDPIADQRVLRNAAARDVAITGITPGPQETEQVLLSAISNNTSLVPHPVIAYAGTGSTATLTFKPQQNQAGTAEITVKAVDSGLNEFTRTFVVTVVDVRIISTPVTIAVPGEVYEYAIETTPVDETLTLVAAQKPGWAALTSTGKNKALLAGIPPTNAASSTVRIQLRDGTTVVDEQEYVLNINRRPTSQSFGLQTNEDVALILGSENFILHYSDADNHPLAEVQFTRLPRHGTLLFGSAPMAVDQVVPVGSLGTVVYQPELNYAGKDTINFRVGDSYSFSQSPSYIHFVIEPVNDPPQITFIETQPLKFDIGRELAQIFTSQVMIEDAEGDDIVSAEIGFRKPNFNSNHDLLEFTSTAKIKGTYDVNGGILSLSGTASVQEYQDAIRTITYNFVNLQDIILDPRTVYIQLSDGKATSEPAERVIELIFNFVDLKIPNVFTPDGNGLNDLWPFKTDEGLEPYNDAIMRVFDRRGKLVYEATGFASPWDGKQNGAYLPGGTYLYVIDLKYGKIKYNGSVTILRAEQ
jgi:gliding motility-associated-like protein